MPQIRRKKITISLVIPFLVIALVFGIMLWNKYQASREVPHTAQSQSVTGKRQAVLFFVADGIRLARESRNIDVCESDTICLKEILDELLNGPIGSYDVVLPEGTVINSVRLDGQMAVVDLNHIFADELAPGSDNEMLAVYSIVDTVCANFPQLTTVRLTVAGNEKTTLHHLDLSDPLVPDYSLEHPEPTENTLKGKP